MDDHPSNALTALTTGQPWRDASAETRKVTEQAKAFGPPSGILGGEETVAEARETLMDCLHAMQHIKADRNSYKEVDDYATRVQAARIILQYEYPGVTRTVTHQQTKASTGPDSAMPAEEDEGQESSADLDGVLAHLEGEIARIRALKDKPPDSESKGKRKK